MRSGGDGRAWVWMGQPPRSGGQAAGNRAACRGGRGPGAASLWTQQAQGRGPGREPTTHTRTHSHTRTRGGGGPGPMHATARRLRVNRDTRRPWQPGSHPPAGPLPAVATHTGAGLVRSHPSPHLPPPTGSLALEAPETPPAPGAAHTLPTRVPSWKNPEKARLSLGAPCVPQPPQDQEHSSLQGLELAADTPGMPTASGRTGVRAGGGVQPRKLLEAWLPTASG